MDRNSRGRTILTVSSHPARSADAYFGGIASRDLLAAGSFIVLDGNPKIIAQQIDYR